VLLGNGNATFTPALHYLTGKTPKGVAIGDVNRDGVPDIVSANVGDNYPVCCSPGGNTISVLLGTGNGSFGVATAYTVGTTPFAVALADIDGDNDLDVASANWDSGDVVILKNITNGGADTTPPTIISVAPADGASGVSVTPAISASFSEAIDPATVTTSTMTLARGGTAVASTVSYDGTTKTANLTPSASLLASTAYTVTVKGGTSGVKDIAGNALASDRVWTFTTAAAGGGSTTSYVSDLTPTSSTNGWGPVEKDRSNGEQGTGDGRTITLNGTTFAKGLGAHAASDVRYALSSCTSFTAQVGVDDEVGTNGSVVFQVFGDSTKLYDSGVMTGATPTKSVNVDLTGKTQLGLVLTNGGDNVNYDHGDWADAKITCGNRVPVPTISQPASTLTYKVGDMITFAGSATDPEDGTLPATALSWQVILHHCPGGVCHTHFFYNTTGSGGSFIVPDHGDNSYFEIILTVTDSAGATASTSVSVQPQTVQLTLASNPTGLTLVYGGVNVTAPFTVTTIVGSTHTIFAPSPQGSSTFAAWSDGGAQQHNVTIGATNLTFTATFTTGP
jgi:hypothetical protein